MPTRDRQHIIRQRKAVWRMAGIAAITFSFTLLGRVMHDQKQAELALTEGEPELRPIKGTRELTAGHVDDTPIASPGNEVWLPVDFSKESAPAQEREGGDEGAQTALVTPDVALAAAEPALQTCLDRWWMLSPTVPSPIHVALEFSESGEARVGLTGVAALPDMIAACVTGAAAAQSAGERQPGLGQIDMTVPSGE